jgi:hypothetical protein
LLKPLGFALLEIDRLTHDVGYMRGSTTEGLYEHLGIAGFGKRGEVVLPSAILSVLRGTAHWRGLWENEAIILEGCDPERLWTRLTSSEQVRDWEDRLVEALPNAFDVAHKKYAADLLERTRPVRLQAQACVAKLPCDVGLGELEPTLRDLLAPTLRALAIRIVDSAGIVVIRDGVALYRVAIYALLLYSDREYQERFTGTPRITKDETAMQLVQITVDLIEQRFLAADRATTTDWE